MGLGYYGRAFTLKDPSCTDVLCEFSGPGKAGECTDAPGTLAWFEIDHIKETNKNSRDIFNSTAQAKILVFDNDQWVGYDDEETLEIKRNWAKENCMRGTMIWSIDQAKVGYGQKIAPVNKPAVVHKHKQTDNIINGIAVDRNPVKMAYPPRPVKANQYGKPGLTHGL